MPWPVFLRRLRHPAPPPGWLEAAADLPDLHKRPMLLRWVVQHLKAPADLRNRLLPTLPWRALAAIAGDAAAHPQARAHAGERLGSRWAAMTLGERCSLAPLAPPSLWPAIWKVRDRRVIAAFLGNPRLTAPALEGLVQRELGLAQATVSQHLKVLKSAGLLQGTLSGPSTCYCVERNSLARLQAGIRAL